MRTLAAALTLSLVVTGPVAASAVEPAAADLTVLATTDVHGHALNWDYFANRPFPEGKELGMSRAATLIDGVREDRGAEGVVLVDNGDAIQGNPLTYYYAKQEPITATGQTHPMAKVYNHLDYDAQVVGNHEFNYGLDLLETYRSQLDFPLLGANVINDDDGQTRLEPYTLMDKTVGGESVTVGVLGVTTPGSRIWDKNNLEGRVHFDDPVVTARKYVPEMKAAGADVVIVLSHSGKDPDGQVWDPSQLQENVSTSVAQVPGVDVLVAGHTHRDEPEEIITRADGTKALITQPNYWARSVSEVDVPIDLGTKTVDWSERGPAAKGLTTQGVVAEDPEITQLLEDQHQTTVDYVNTTIGSVTETMSAATSYYEDTPILDFISNVQTRTVEEALADTEYADVPVLSQASPFSRTAEFPAGDITIRDVAGLYVYDNTLGAVALTGAQLRDYLEYSARFFTQTEEGAEFDPVDGTNAVDEATGAPIPDYNFDALSGVDYDINVSKPVGERIENLTDASGAPVADDDRFVLAINNYRQSGGGGYPVGDLEEVYDEQVEIRQALIEWTQQQKVVDPKDFYDENWRVVTRTREPGDDSDAGAGSDSAAESDSAAGADASAEVGAGDDASASDDSTGGDDASGSDDSSGGDEASGGDRASAGSGSTASASSNSTTSAGSNSSASADGGRLPRTGADVLGAIGIAAAILALGATLILAARRRSR